MCLENWLFYLFLHSSCSRHNFYSRRISHLTPSSLTFFPSDSICDLQTRNLSEEAGLSCSQFAFPESLPCACTVLAAPLYLIFITVLEGRWEHHLPLRKLSHGGSLTHPVFYTHQQEPGFQFRSIKFQNTHSLCSPWVTKSEVGGREETQKRAKLRRRQ